LKRSREFTSLLNENEINSLFSLDKFTDNVDSIFSRVFDM